MLEGQFNPFNGLFVLCTLLSSLPGDCNIVDQSRATSGLPVRIRANCHVTVPGKADANQEPDIHNAGL